MNNPSSKIVYLLLIVTWLSISTSAFSQCFQPYNPSFSNRTTSSIQVNWLDFNSSVLYWELELVEANESFSGLPTHTNIISPELNINGLESSSIYSLYIRTVCNEDNTSDWNGPYNFVTAFNNPSSCDIGLGLRDNNCNFPDRFFIQVEEQGILGQDIFINSVELNIKHDWPADLKIELISPNGSISVLSENNGVVTDDFGDINDLSCSSNTIFNDDSCSPISSGIPPFIGEYSPDSPLRDLYGTEVNGLWELRICDNTINDIGELRYVELKFDNNSCETVQEAYIEDVDATTANICWTPPSNCQQMKVFYGLEGTPRELFSVGFLECNKLCFTMDSLMADSCYDVILQSDCNQFEAAETCVYSFCTTCTDITEFENFDDYDICNTHCDSICTLPDTSFWQNVETDDGDWKIFSGNTPTTNTGPFQAYGNPGGNYVYTEVDPSNCGLDQKSILLSKCININEPSECSMSFQYFMFGTDIGRLSLEISTNGGALWKTIFTTSGDQSNVWQEAIIDLTEYSQTKVKLRFSSFGSLGSLGDIAVDDIKFFGPVFIEEEIYYLDKDGDGFGDSSTAISFCQNDIPNGFTDMSGDCDDNNPAIHPNSIEIKCNQVDENCNGMDDDNDPEDIIQIEVTDIQNALCQGKNDGFIIIKASGGNGPPYNYVWSNGDMDTIATNLLPGKYQVSVSDDGGCVSISDSIEIFYNSELQININAQDPTCSASNNGYLELQFLSGVSPYETEWDHGPTASILEDLDEGIYSVTVSDSLGCTKSIQNIELIAEKSLISGISFQKNNKCFGDQTGILEVNSQNGTAPYKYQWSTTDTTQRITDLANGSYSVTIIDDEGCESMVMGNISSPDSIQIDLVDKIDPSCSNLTNGSIQTEILGGKLPYNYEWKKNGLPINNPIASNHFINIGAGEYQLIIFDNNACMAESEIIVLNHPEELVASIDTIISSSCLSSNDGMIKMSLEGGVEPLNYTWKGSDSDTLIADSLVSGVYHFTAFDASNCKVSFPNIEVEHGNKPSEVSADVISFNRCHNDSIADISVTIASGVPPFDYNWSIGKHIISNNSTDTIVDLHSGDYQITITDNEGCVSISETIIIPEIEAIRYVVDSIHNNPCFEDSLGAVYISVEGGTGDLTYSWSNQESTVNIFDLKSGSYFLTITDQNQCLLETNSILVTDPGEIKIESEVIHPEENVANGCIYLEITGGNPPYIINWPNELEDDILNHCDLPAGDYQIEVIDDNDCIRDTLITLDHSLSIHQTGLDNSFDIFPNPALNKINIISKIENIAIEIIDLHGKNWRNMVLYNKKEILNISELPSGVYYIRFNHNGLFYQRKFVIL